MAYIATLLLVSVAHVTAGCDGDSASSDDAGADRGVPLARCPAGMQARGPACVPVFDYCKAGEVALSGGGCKRVGAPGTCLESWTLVKEGWCEPVLPAGLCPKGSMAVIGEATCQPILDCGSGKYGNIKLTAKTIHVDRSYSRADSDGSIAKPYQSIDDALSAAPSGAHVAVAAGEYLEDLTINRPVTLEGRCPRMVTVKGYKTDHEATIRVTASGAVIRGLTVTGSHTGIELASATKVLVERCAVRDNAKIGLAAVFKSEGTVRYSLLEGNHLTGVGAGSRSTVTVDHCDVRNTREKLDGNKKYLAHGLFADDDSWLTVMDSVISDNGPEAGIHFHDSKGRILRSVIGKNRDRPRETEVSSAGVRVQEGSEVVIQDSLIADNRQFGILALESTLTVERSVIRGTRPRTVDKKDGHGILLRAMQGQPGKLALTDSTISDNSSKGVFLLGGLATLKRVLIRKTGSARGNNPMPHGLSTAGGTETIPMARLHLDTCLLEDNTFVGMMLGSGSDVVVSRSTIRSSRVRSWISSVENKYGGGIWVQEWTGPRKKEYKMAALAKILDSLFEKIEGPGLTVLFGGTASVERSLIRDTSALEGLAMPAVLVQSSETYPEEPAPVLSMKDSAVKNTPGVGVQVRGAKANLKRCVVEHTRAIYGAYYGDGISIEKTEQRNANLDLTSCLVKDSARAGLIFFGSTGKVCRSTFQNNKYAIDLEKGASPVICGDNRYVDNERDVVFGLGLKSAPVPWIPELPDVSLPKTGK